MDQYARNQLQSIISQLSQVSRQLNEAAGDLSGMRGVGTEACAGKLRQLSSKYKRAERELRKL